MDNTYSVTLADGTVLSDLSLSGNNFKSSVAISADIFEDNCSPVVISDGEVEEIHSNMELVQVTQVGEEYWFILRDLTDAELQLAEIIANQDYIAMMTGIEL